MICATRCRRCLSLRRAARGYDDILASLTLTGHFSYAGAALPSARIAIYHHYGFITIAATRPPVRGIGAIPHFTYLLARC